MDQLQQKIAAANAALEYTIERLTPESILGIGTGSTVDLFIDALAEHRGKFSSCVSSSERSSERLAKYGIDVIELDDVERLDLYVDGADETNEKLEVVKGGGGALTREKIVAAVCDQFVCIADRTKWVQKLGSFPLPLEVIPMAQSHVATQVRSLGGNPVLRDGFVTDNGNIILDVHNLQISHAINIEETLNQVVGLVTNGLFAKRPADVLFLADQSGVDFIVKT